MEIDELAQFINASRVLDRTLNAILAEDGLREDLWRIMHALAQQPGMLMGEISEKLTLPAATTTRLVDQLADNGLVFRRPAPEDGRKAAVHLSRTGHERLSRVASLISARSASLKLPVLQRA
ncbi:MarR family winged helix-turn-helix transcriptional regulator [Pseudarthrobacter sp. NPDC058329]|uniref:MarR family winged helix-turn-helix transcriptional regulator n=1 Tax=Pseudarthrobacter sp. NPDC058329 TaxID=3346448 RepID=UPI0036D8EFA2